MTIYSSLYVAYMCVCVCVFESVHLSFNLHACTSHQQCDGEDLTQKIRNLHLEAIVFQNIPSYGSGLNPWGTPSSRDKVMGVWHTVNYMYMYDYRHVHFQYVQCMVYIIYLSS